MSKNVLLLEVLPNFISSIVQTEDKEGKTIYYYRHFNWDKPYCNNVRKGDEFFLINREDVDEPGIYMHGFCDSDEILTPVHWSERGVSRVYLRDVQVADPKKYRPLSIPSLQAAMPEFNWSPGPSGRRITGPYIKIIRRMWKKYLAMNDHLEEKQKDRNL